MNVFLCASIRCALLTACICLMISTVAFAGEPNAEPTLGTNLGFLRSNSGEWPFIDLFKTTEPWIPGDGQCWGCPAAGSLDIEDGWVRSLASGQLAHTVLFNDVNDELDQLYHPSGYYTVLWDGVGTLEYDGCASRISHDPVAREDRIYLDPAIAEPLVITLTATGTPTGTGDHLTNLRIIPDGGACSNAPSTSCIVDADCSGSTCRQFIDHHEDLLFNPRFLENLEPFGVVRLMDWWAVNDFSPVDYSEVPTRQSARWNIAPGEVMAELANIADVDIWVNIPHSASPMFVQDFANELNRGLEAGRKVYVQFSNEVWNPGYPQYLAVSIEGCGLYGLDCNTGDADENDATVCQGHPWPNWVENCNTARIRRNADRTRAIWNTFATTLGVQRVVRVMASQLGNTWLHQDLLDWNQTYIDADVLATAAYFGWTLGDDEVVAGWSDARLMQELRDVEIPATRAEMVLDAQMLAGNPNYAHIEQVFYEGGQHLQAFGDVEEDPVLLNNMNALFNRANRSPEMAVRYQELLDGWIADGGGVLLMHYVNVHSTQPWGRFGALEHQDQPHSTSHKYSALESYAASLASTP